MPPVTNPHLGIYSNNPSTLFSNYQNRNSREYYENLFNVNSKKQDDNFKVLTGGIFKQKIGINDSEIVNFEVQFKYEIQKILEHLRQISHLISTTIIAYKIGNEWTKDERYKIWFDKWVDITEGILWRLNRNGTVSTLVFPRLTDEYFYTKNVFKDLFREHGGYDEEKFNGHTRKFCLNSGNLRKNSPGITLETFLGFYPEMISSFANTFIYRLVELKVADGKTRKITLVNNKLPEYIKRQYKNIDCSNNIFNKTWFGLLNNSALINPNDSIFVKNAVKGFRPAISYLDHVKAHTKAKSLMTCDVNKFYNTMNLKNIIDNNIFGQIFDVMLDHSRSYYQSKSYELDDITSSYILYLRNLYSGLFNTVLYFHTFNGVIPTGTSAAPMMTNLLMLPFDLNMAKYINAKNGLNFGNTKPVKFVYTRYVDDICVSANQDKIGNEYTISIETAKEVEAILNKYSLHLKYAKTKIFGAKDVKVISNLNLPRNNVGDPSIGSKYKLELKEAVNGFEYADLDDKTKGILSWVKSVNPSQYNFITSGIKKLPKKLETRPSVSGSFNSHTVTNNLSGCIYNFPPSGVRNISGQYITTAVPANPYLYYASNPRYDVVTDTITRDITNTINRNVQNRFSRDFRGRADTPVTRAAIDQMVVDEHVNVLEQRAVGEMTRDELQAYRADEMRRMRVNYPASYEIMYGNVGISMDEYRARTWNRYEPTTRSSVTQERFTQILNGLS